LARYRESVCRICRRENMKLFLKGDRCYSDRCAWERRSYPPGQHGQRRGKYSDYGVQLREKQKVRRIYGLLEKQFKSTFEKADSQKGITGTNLLLLLEGRLDNVVYRLGFANSRNQARQLIRHRHFLINGRKVDIPSFQLKAGDKIQLEEKVRNNPLILSAMEAVMRRGVPPWLEMNAAIFEGTVKAIPTREEITMPIQEQLVVELYSK
jgi:small subunit ribosomal protein S4